MISPGGVGPGGPQRSPVSRLASPSSSQTPVPGCPARGRSGCRPSAGRSAAPRAPMLVHPGSAPPAVPLAQASRTFPKRPWGADPGLLAIREPGAALTPPPRPDQLEERGARAGDPAPQGRASRGQGVLRLRSCGRARDPSSLHQTGGETEAQSGGATWPRSLRERRLEPRCATASSAVPPTAQVGRARRQAPAPRQASAPHSPPASARGPRAPGRRRLGTPGRVSQRAPPRGPRTPAPRQARALRPKPPPRLHRRRRR